MVTNSIYFWTSIVTILNNNYTNSYYLFLIVELLTVNSNFYIRIVTMISSIVFFRKGNYAVGDIYVVKISQYAKCIVHGYTCVYCTIDTNIIIGFGTQNETLPPLLSETAFRQETLFFFFFSFLVILDLRVPV